MFSHVQKHLAANLRLEKLYSSFFSETLHGKRAYLVWYNVGISWFKCGNGQSNGVTPLDTPSIVSRINMRKTLDFPRFQAIIFLNSSYTSKRPLNHASIDLAETVSSRIFSTILESPKGDKVLNSTANKGKSLLGLNFTFPPLFRV
ncbi:MAG: hypothetical protein N3E48_05160 [Candidatus Bathyarchaeota archaeon]|nr:hypothetical protein [Candidatus Bathyarchaeota archaeon]